MSGQQFEGWWVLTPAVSLSPESNRCDGRGVLGQHWKLISNPEFKVCWDYYLEDEAYSSIYDQSDWVHRACREPCQFCCCRWLLMARKRGLWNVAVHVYIHSSTSKGQKSVSFSPSDLTRCEVRCRLWIFEKKEDEIKRGKEEEKAEVRMKVRGLWHIGGNHIRKCAEKNQSKYQR